MVPVGERKGFECLGQSMLIVGGRTGADGGYKLVNL